MSKPTVLPEWATSGSAAVVEPLIAEKQLGWVAATKPPAQWFNWWFKLVYQWIVWLDAFESTAHTWSAIQTFNSNATFGAGVTVTITDTLQMGGSSNAYFNGGSFTGGTLSLQPPDAVTPSIVGVAAGAGRRLFLRWQVQTTPAIYARIYASPPASGATNGMGAGLEFTYNCAWNGSAWVRDSATQTYGRVVLGQGLQVYANNDTTPLLMLGAKDAGTYNGGFQTGYTARDMLVLDSGGRIVVGQEQTQNGWANVSLAANNAAAAGYAAPRYVRDSMGFAHFEGMSNITSAIVNGTQIATLDASVRPSAYSRFHVPVDTGTSTGAYLEIDTSGNVSLFFGGTFPIATNVLWNFSFKAV
jgi:hypothetical protein